MYVLNVQFYLSFVLRTLNCFVFTKNVCNWISINLIAYISVIKANYPNYAVNVDRFLVRCIELLERFLTFYGPFIYYHILQLCLKPFKRTSFYLFHGPATR